METTPTDRRPLGYFAHAHGSGHVVRAKQIARAISRPVTILSSHPTGYEESEHYDYLQLPEDHAHLTTYDQQLAPLPDCLHHAPVNVYNLQDRMAATAQWIAEHRPVAMVTDVSVEVALFARLCSVPTLVFRQSGPRIDTPHIMAYQSARALICCYPESLEDPTTPDWIREKTVYLGGFSRFEGKLPEREAARRYCNMSPERQYVVVVSGMGGSGNSLQGIIAAAESSPEHDFWAMGKVDVEQFPTLPTNLKLLGYIADPLPYLVGADIILASAGNNTIMEVATVGRPYICIPEERPFAEQVYKARALARNGMAVVRESWDMTPAEWRSTLREAEQMDTAALQSIINPDAFEVFDGLVEQVASEYQHTPQPAAPTTSVLTLVRNRRSQLTQMMLGLQHSEVQPRELLVVHMNEDPYPDLPELPFPVRQLVLRTPDEATPLGRARAMAAQSAKGEHLLFLDVDCIPAPNFIGAMQAAVDDTGGLVMGQPHYLPKSWEELGSAWSFEQLDERAIPHPHRSYLTPDEIRREHNYAMFWSLCFGMRRAQYLELGGFDGNHYRGYGAEDTDFAFMAERAGVPFHLIGARCYHQYHDVYRPPLNNFESIVDNAHAFREKWGRWAMEGWLREFEQMGYIEWEEQGERLDVVRMPTDHEIAATLEPQGRGF